VALQAQSPPSSSQTPDDLRDAIRARTAAIAHIDTAAWSRLTADDYSVVQADGRVLNKAQRLAQFKRERPTNIPPFEDESFQLYGTAAVHRFKVGGAWVLEVWVKGAGGWRIANTQVTLIEEEQ
jgi:hypothetical protein